MDNWGRRHGCHKFRAPQSVAFVTGETVKNVNYLIINILRIVIFYKPQQNRNSRLMYGVTTGVAGKTSPPKLPTFEF
jgi:hypothetical protein